MAAETKKIVKVLGKRKYEGKFEKKFKPRLMMPYAKREAKYVDVAAANYGNSTTGSITHCSIVPQGTTVNSRDGRACRITSVRIRGHISNGTAATQNHAINYLVWDYQPNKALAAVTDVFDAINAYALPKKENQSRFKILRTWHYILIGDADAQTAQSNAMHAIDEYVRLPKNCIATYTTSDTTGVIGNCISGALLFITVGNNATGGNLDAVTSVSIRTNFSDI